LFGGRSAVSQRRREPVVLGREVLAKVDTVGTVTVERADDREPVTLVELVASDGDDFVVAPRDERVGLRRANVPARFQFEAQELVGRVVATDLFERFPRDAFVRAE
jgi:hypothetical protein